MGIEETKRRLLNLSKGSIVTEFNENDDKKSDWFVIPSYDLNRILSGSLYKTVQSKNHIALVGEEATGKSSIAALIAKDCQNKGYIPLIIDCEGNWSANNAEFCKRWGLDVNNLIWIKSLWVEDISLEMARIAENKVENIVIILDSIGALESKKVLKDAIDKNDIKDDQGQVTRKIKRLLKVMVSLVKFNNSMLITCGHIYSDPNAFTEKIYGGNYFKLSSDIILRLYKTSIYENPNGKTKKEKGKIIGNEIIAYSTKNRIAPPYQTAVLNIDFQKGVDKLAGIIDLCLDIGFIKQSGAWYTCDDLNIKSQGIENLKKDLYSANYNVLLDKIEDHLKTTGYSSVNRELELQEEKNEESQADIPNDDIEPPEYDKVTEGGNPDKIESSSTTKKKKSTGRPKKNSK